MWRREENSENITPNAIEYCGNHVIMRKGFRLVEATEDKPEHYEYDEWQMTKEQYEIYKDFEQKINEQDDALIELAGLISEVV